MDAVGRPSVRYAPGPWVAIAGTGVWLLAETDPDGPVVAACWEAIDQGAGVDHVLGLILREGLRTVPSFALAGLTASGMRILVEGKAKAELRMPGDDSDATSVTADGAPTWTERTVDGPIDLRLLAEGGGSTRPTVPLVSGVVFAAELSLGGVRAESPSRPATLIPMPEPPIVAARPGPAARPRPDVSPETLQAPAEGSSHAQTLDHIVADADLAAPEGDPVPDLPAPDTVHVSQVGQGLIDALPWKLPVPQHAADETTGEVRPDPGVGRPWAPPPSGPPVGPPVHATSIAGIDGGAAPNPFTLQGSATPIPANGPVVPPTVAAVSCPNQHLNPPYASGCRICGSPLPPQETFTAPRPPLGVLHLSTGETVPLDRDVVLGRAPFLPDVGVTSRPHLVQLASPGNDISRSHVRVGLEGWHVQVVDLGSINGTVVSLPGQPPVRLRAHDPFTIVPGTTISIADEVTARFDSIDGARR